MSPTRILLDCDGVLADFIGGVLPLVREVTGRECTHADVAQFDFCAALGLSIDDARAVKRLISLPGFAATLRPLSGSQEGVEELIGCGHDVHIVTSPWNSNPTWTHDREAWLRKHYSIRHSHVTHTSAKYLCAGDVFIDDRTSALAEWQKAHPEGAAIRWNTPHNKLEPWEGLIAGATSSWSWLVEFAGGR